MGEFFDSPGYNAEELITFQIGQCRLKIQTSRTAAFYAAQPKIVDNCACGNCKYYESEVINQPNGLFEVLKKMGVDLSRQPDVNPDGISCVGDPNLEKSVYIGYYLVYGKIAKTSKKNTKMQGDIVREVAFCNGEFGTNTQVTIKQIEDDKIFFDFYLSVERKV